jgi:uracil-DNA glycosylase
MLELSDNSSSEVIAAQKQARLDELKSAVLADAITPELAEQATQLVMGEGNPNADIVFIGEAPGKKEDEQGRPFVGASGKFLNEMLLAAGLERSDVYITNIVKYRPPNNRDPKPAEKQAFRSVLAQQLAIINPAVIVTLGRHSMEFFLPGAVIGDVHGKPVTATVQDSGGAERQWQLVPLYHPAAALYNGSLRQTLIDDFMTVPSLLK